MHGSREDEVAASSPLAGVISMLPHGRRTRKYSIYPITPRRVDLRGAQVCTRLPLKIQNRNQSCGKFWRLKHSRAVNGNCSSSFCPGNFSALSPRFRKANCNCLFAALHLAAFCAFAGLKRAMLSAPHGAGNRFTRAFAVPASA